MARRIAPPARRSLRRSAVVAPAICAALLWAGVAVLVWRFGLSLYLAWLVGGTVATGLVFAFDKLQSKNAGRRVPEIVLLALVLLGGVIGGWIGMIVVRHKTQHSRFWLMQWVASGLHIAVFWWLFSTHAAWIYR